MEQLRRFRFKAKYLKALQVFMAKKDIRFYLNGFLVKPADHDQGVMLVASDGHRLVAIHDKTGHANGECIIKPSAQFFSAGTKTGKQSDTSTIPEYIESFGNTVAIISSMYGQEYQEENAFEFTPGTLYAEYCENIPGKFPDYKRVLNVELKPATEPFTLNPLYMQDLKHICPDAERTFPGVTAMTTGDNSSILFTSKSNPEILAIIMPMREDLKLKDFLPEFVKIKTEAKTEVA